ncbi:MAG: jmjC domain-containing histone demethylation protein 2B [Olpidium bornovanus]|uniref:JmjC domain-containing histone demethylation protein 2B n=1 Tax=Olpidium bornovanus TaxID=278681 RepID=A0A8H7ZNX8_9FUNG|nr:MAG: jmjC domain-containing histone demethylation protein 2B [Olpidium bornovanus]
MSALPYPEYTRPNGHLNLVSYLPKEFSPPDLGPKMYNAYAAQELDATVRRGSVGTTCLHLDMADAVNLMVHVGPDEDSENNDGESDQVGAVWDIFPADKLDVLREFLQTEVIPRKPLGEAVGGASGSGEAVGGRPGSGRAAGGEPRSRAAGAKGGTASKSGLAEAADVIHDQVVYLTDEERRSLHEKYGVQGWRVYQKPGDAVYVPAGCVHQVANVRSAVKVAMDFVSPEHVGRALNITGEFRRLPAKHRRRQDLLQLKNILWATWMNLSHGDR